MTRETPSTPAVLTWVLLVYFFLFKISEAYSRTVFLIWSCSTPLILFGLHLLVCWFLRFYRAQGRNICRAVIVEIGRAHV